MPDHIPNLSDAVPDQPFHVVPSNPRVLLGAINQQLRGLLDATGRLFPAQAPEIRNLENVLRQTTILQMLQGEYVVGIAGMTGAGKSTFISQLYGLGRMASGRTGVGEKLPVWVREMEGLSAPQLFVHLYSWESADQSEKIRREKVTDEDEFERIALAQQRPPEGELYIMLEIHVPPLVFGVEGYGFLLLPGWEQLHMNESETSDSDQLVVFSLIAAARYILVVGNVANYQELDAHEQFRQWFDGSEPLYVIPRNDQNSDPQTLKTSLIEKLGLAPSETDRVINTGENDIETWRAQLAEALRKYASHNVQAETLQLQRLAELFDKKLYETLNDIRRAADTSFMTEHTVMEGFLSDYMDLYERSAKRARDEFWKEFDQAFGDALAEFIRQGETSYGKTSFWQHLGNFAFRHGAPSEKALKKAKEAAMEAWNQHMADFLDRFYEERMKEALETEQLKLPLGELGGIHPEKERSKQIEDALRRLPVLAAYALMKRPQRASFLRDNIQQPRPAQAQGTPSLLSAGLNAASNFIPSGKARAAAALASVFVKVGESAQKAEQDGVKRQVRELSFHLYDQSRAGYLEDYTRLADQLQTAVRNALAGYLRVSDLKNDYRDIRLRLTRMRDFVTEVKTLVNRRLGYIKQR